MDLGKKNGNTWDRYWARWIIKYGHTLKFQDVTKTDCADIPPDFVIGKDVMEVGCGIGIIPVGLAHVTNSFFGFDISPLAIMIAQTLCPKNAEFHTIQTDAGILNIATSKFECFDTVLVRHVFIHIGAERVLKMLGLAKKVLKPGGIIYANFFKRGTRQYGEGEIRKPDTIETSGAVIEYKEDDIKSMYKDHGFEIVEFAGDVEKERYFVTAIKK